MREHSYIFECAFDHPQHFSIHKNRINCKVLCIKMDQSEDLFAGTDNSDEEFIENIKKINTVLSDLDFVKLLQMHPSLNV